MLGDIRHSTYNRKGIHMLHPTHISALKAALVSLQSVGIGILDSLNSDSEVGQEEDDLQRLYDLSNRVYQLESTIGGTLIEGTKAAYVVVVEKIHHELCPVVFAVSKELPRKIGELGTDAGGGADFVFQATEHDGGVIVTLPVWYETAPVLLFVDDEKPWSEMRGGGEFAAFSTLERARNWSQQHCGKDPHLRPSKEEMHRGPPQDLLHHWY
jgi:hypothetical protein